MTAQDSIASLIDFICTSRNLSIGEDSIARASAAIENRFKAVGTTNAERYRDYLQVHPHEYKQFLNEFFRSKQFLINDSTWAVLKPFLLDKFQRPEFGAVRAWVVACGDGAEALGLLIATAELLENPADTAKIKIFATDVEEDLNVARSCSYRPEQLEKALPASTIGRYFTRANGLYSFSTELRKSVIFGKHDVTQDPPICRMDLIVCRQVFAYLNADAQEKAVRILSHALSENGLLLLNECERLPETADLVQSSSIPYLYRKNTKSSRKIRRNFDAPEERIGSLIDAALDVASVATVCVDNNGIVVSINSSARHLFNLLPQDLGKPLQDLEFSYRPAELRSLIDLANEENRTVVLNRVVKNNSHGKPRIFDLHVTPLQSNGENNGVNIEFQDGTDMYNLRDELLQLNQQLQTANEELQSSHEELETTNEELHSTNEELETTNEELQSTNEELETMNEELQSTNTELELSNNGQRDLAEAVEGANSFFESILASIQSSLFVLNPDYKIAVWNQRSSELWGLRRDETIGRDIFSLDLGFPLASLREPLRLVEEGSAMERYVIKAINRRGQTLDCDVRVISLASMRGFIILINEVVQPQHG